MRSYRKGLPVAMSLALGVLTWGAVEALSGQTQGTGNRKGELIDPTGKPKGFQKGESVRYAIWHDKHSWHLRTTTAKREHHFKGHLRIEDGHFTKIHSFDLEKTGKLADHWSLDEPKRQDLRFDFKTDRGLDGIDFHVSKSATFIHFNLHIDGKVHDQRVFIGSKGQHPRHNPFKLVAHP
jgi:hypothetical protein